MGVRLGICLVITVAVAAAAPAGATPPGANGPIVWQSFKDAPAYEIWTMDPTGLNQVQITDNSVHEERAQISADRSMITFQSYRAGDGAVDSHEIYTMEADGDNQTALTDDDDTDFEPTWSPDGSKIVWMKQTNGVPAGEAVAQDLWVMNAGGSGKTRLTPTQYIDECCAEYSPDGTKIAFTASGYFDGFPGTYYPNNVWVMNADGTGVTPLTAGTGDVQSFHPTWSPDGDEIAYIHTENAANQPYHIYTMDSDGSSEAPLATSTSFYAPVWSPDGTKIAAQVNNEIVAVDVATPTTITNLSNNGSTQDEYPSWAPAAGGGGDTEAPTATILEVKRKHRKRKAVMSFTGSDNVDPPASLTFECQVDGKPVVTGCTSPHVFRNLKPKRHTVRVRATDTSANVGAYAERGFKIKG